MSIVLCIRSQVLSVFTVVHTLIFGGDIYIVSGMSGGLLTKQRGFFLSHEGLRLSWLGGYGSYMEWNGGRLIIEQRGFFPSREGLRLSWLRGYIATKGHIYCYCGSISYSGCMTDDWQMVHGVRVDLPSLERLGLVAELEDHRLVFYVFHPTGSVFVHSFGSLNRPESIEHRRFRQMLGVFQHGDDDGW